MDGNNWRAAQGHVQIPGQGEAVAAAGMEGSDWRIHLPADARQRIVCNITETLKMHLPFHGQEGLQEAKKIAVKFEEKIYTVATSQSDYLRKISLKMLILETRSQNPMANSLQSNAARNSKNPQDPASQSMQNQVQQLPIPMVSHQSQMHTYRFGAESPAVRDEAIIAQLRQALSLKDAEIVELKSKNASLENMVSDLQARVRHDEEKYHTMTRMMSQLNMLC